jgi:hypothetical protein
MVRHLSSIIVSKEFCVPKNYLSGSFICVPRLLKFQAMSNVRPSFPGGPPNIGACAMYVLGIQDKVSVIGPDPPTLGSQGVDTVLNLHLPRCIT